MTNQSFGTLYVVATPIGNLEDLSPRAISIMNQAQLILCEDTRNFGRIKKRFSITTTVQSYHDHNEKSRSTFAIQRLIEGHNIALVSDAGTPCISDPGYRLVNQCYQNQVNVRAIAGPSAMTSALSICGFEINRFMFEGFLPIKSGKRKKRIEEILNLGLTTVIYESPHRICKTLALIQEIDSSRDLFIARELSKIYEETLRGSAQELYSILSHRPSVKGELVLIVRGTT